MVARRRVSDNGTMTRHRRKSPLNLLWLPAVALAFLGYFGYHALNGAYGLWSLERLESEAAELRIRLDALRAERAALERKVSFLRPDSLDADVVDIEARLSLNLLRPDEVVISFGAVQHQRP
jgi:cell division protein FtsB